MLEGHHPDSSPEHPYLRRVIEITDFDTGIPITHRIELYRSNRIDCYNVAINGLPDYFNFWPKVHIIR